MILRSWAGGLIALSVASSAAASVDRYVVEGARIFTGTGVIEGGALVVDSGVIVSIGPSVEAPEGAWVIDARGKVVYPGFIDALGRLGLGPKPKPDRGANGGDRSNEVIARGPEDRPGTSSWKNAADELRLDDERIEKWRSAGFTSAVTAPDEGIFPGQAAFINLAGEREREMVVATPVALRVNLEPPGSGRSYPGSLMGVLAYVKQVFIDAAHYRESWEAYESAPLGKTRPTYDRAIAPIAEAQAGGWPVLLPASREHEIARAIELSRELGAKPVLYGVHQGYAAAERLASENVPVLVSLEWPKREEEADPEKEEPLRVLEMRERAPGTPAALEKAGVAFAFYSGGIEKPREALASVRNAIDAGLSREGAVRALSLDAARIYGLDDRLGSLEPGKIANLFIATGEVFEEGTRIETVFVDGKKFEIREEPSEEEQEEKKTRGGSR